MITRVLDSGLFLSIVFVILSTAIVLMSACTAPYEVDVRSSLAKPGMYFVVAEGARFADDSTLTRSWHKRAHRLCANGYDSIVNPPAMNANPRSPKRVTGYVRCQ